MVCLTIRKCVTKFHAYLCVCEQHMYMLKRTYLRVRVCVSIVQIQYVDMRLYENTGSNPHGAQIIHIHVVYVCVACIAK